ncbi:MAG: pyridoxamine 5'-phosphate oxidase family protein [Proteobacteria bacterium]|nr:pyridoxamine 5'-phosphate oxidase family protein [Pseudomonadota bacterium]
MKKIVSKAHLREIYPPAMDRAVLKQMPSLDLHARRFIELSPFVVLATKGADGRADATPRGGAPGFVRVENQNSVLLPDWPGNNRLDSLENIIECPGVGLLFMIPGVNETLRINGNAEIVIDDGIRQLFEAPGKLPRSIIRVNVAEAYLHCAKALMRSRLWEETIKIDRSSLPSMGQMLKDQIASPGIPESQVDMEKRYSAEQY